jgi:hypothetical protein
MPAMRNVAYLAKRVREETQQFTPDALIDGYEGEYNELYPEAASILSLLNWALNDLLETGYCKCYFDMTLDPDSDSGEYNLPGGAHNIISAHLIHPSVATTLYRLEPTSLVELNEESGGSPRWRVRPKSRPRRFYTDIGNAIGFHPRPNLAYIARLLCDSVPGDMEDEDDYPAPIYDEDGVTVIGSRLPEAFHEILVYGAAWRIARMQEAWEQAALLGAEWQDGKERLMALIQTRELPRLASSSRGTLIRVASTRAGGW